MAETLKGPAPLMGPGAPASALSSVPGGPGGLGRAAPALVPETFLGGQGGLGGRRARMRAGAGTSEDWGGREG